MLLFSKFIRVKSMEHEGGCILAASDGLEPCVSCFLRPSHSVGAKNAAKLCCSIFKQTTQEIRGKKKKKKRRSDPARCGAPALAPTPPPGEDRVQNLGNPERAGGALAAAHPGDVTFPSLRQTAQRCGGCPTH